MFAREADLMEDSVCDVASLKSTRALDLAALVFSNCLPKLLPVRPQMFREDWGHCGAAELQPGAKGLCHQACLTAYPLLSW